MHLYICIYLHILIFLYITCLYILVHINISHKRTHLRTILTKKIRTNEAERSKRGMQLPSVWNFLCCTFTLSWVTWRWENMDYYFFRMLRLSSLCLTSMARASEECWVEMISPPGWGLIPKISQSSGGGIKRN